MGDTEEDIGRLVALGNDWITRYGGQQSIVFADEEQERLKKEEETITEQVLSNIIQTSLKSPQTIIGKVFDRIGFNAVQDEELRHLVISRICSPIVRRRPSTISVDTSRKM